MPPLILDPTLSVDEAIARFSSAVPQVAPCSTSLEPSSLDEFLASSGLEKNASLNWIADYIVIGGGTAGLAVASRLAENNPAITVCVIEAGIPRDDPVVKVPGLYGMAVGHPDYDWGYKTTPQPQLNDREIPSSAGRLLGGSSAINYLVRMRASAPEYDAWSNFSPGWDWKGLLPYFKKEESHIAPNWNTDQIFPGITKEQDEEARKQEPTFRGYSGPVHSSNNDLYTDLEKPTIETLNNLGIRTNRTPGHGDSTGMFNIDTTVNRATGQRSEARSYLKGNLKNLHILQSSWATKILFRPGVPGCTADAVEFAWIPPAPNPRPHPQPHLPPTVPPFGTIYAKKEIIVSAGTYNTPRLLELSGVGNPAILRGFGITTVVDLPGVGENLQEHPLVTSDFVVKDHVFTFDRLRNDSSYKLAQEREYTEKCTGAYATTVAAYGFIKLDRFLSESEIQDLKQQLVKEISWVTNPFHKQQLAIQQGYLEDQCVGDVELIMVPKVFATSQPEQGKSYLSLIASLPHTVPRGTVHITSQSPFDPPKIDPGYLESAFDAKILVKATEFIRKISESEPLGNLVDKPSTPAATVITEKQFENYVRNHTFSLQHPVGTASMAPRTLGGVVDSNLLVYGTTNLRIADMSVVPLHLAAHIQDTAYAIGEKAFALITGQTTLLK